MVVTLLSFSIPSIASLQIQNRKVLNEREQLQVQDPNEIDIDDQENVTFSIDSNNLDNCDGKPLVYSSFLDFGLGPLYSHPVVCLYFPGISSDITTEPFISSAAILNCLASSDTNLRYASTDEMEVSLCAEFGVKHLLDLGIILGGNLKMEMLMISHVHAARMKLLTEIQKKLLNDYACQEKNIRESYPSSGQRSDRKSIARNNAASGCNEVGSDEINTQNVPSSGIIPKLSVPVRPNIISFMTQCEMQLADSSYSPSFSKAFDAVDKICKEGINRIRKLERKNDTKSSKKRARRTIETIYTDFEEASSYSNVEVVEIDDEATTGAGCVSMPLATLDLLKEVAAEYLMLHIGGEKYRAKRFMTTKDYCLEEVISANHESLNQMEPGQEMCSGPESVSGSATTTTKKFSVNDDKGDSEKSRFSDSDRLDPFLASFADGNVVCPLLKQSDGNDLKNTFSDATGVDIVDLSESDAKGKTIPTTNCGVDVAPFECKLFSHSSASCGKGTAKLSEQGQQREGCSIFTISNDDLRDITPWCKSVPLGGESKGAALLDGTDLRAVGRWGEALVYQYLLQSSSSSVEWLNIEEESRAGYDIIVRQPIAIKHVGSRASSRPPSMTRTTYVEVKTTRFDDLNTFEISLWEWQFATANPRVRYHIYRVFNAGDPKRVRVVVVEDILELITSRKVRLCLSI